MLIAKVHKPLVCTSIANHFILAPLKPSRTIAVITGITAQEIDHLNVATVLERIHGAQYSVPDDEPQHY
jgi:hypothetical protein